MAYNSPKIGSTLFTTPVRTTTAAQAETGIPDKARDPLRTTRLSVLACGKSLLYVPQLRQ
jgi:hypothetical protein